VSDMDLYMKLQRQQDRTAPRRKQDGFEFRVLSKLLRALEPQPGWAKRTMFEVGDDLSLTWFNDRYEGCPVKLGSYKLKDTLGVLAIMTKYDKTKLSNEFDELQSNYPDNAIGLVFDSVGSGLSELIIHNWCEELPISKLGWRIQVATDQHGLLEIAPLKGFLSALAGNFQLEET